MPDITVHTVDARGNVLLDVMQDYFGLDSEQVRHTIVDAVNHVTAALRARGVEYDALRNALTPQLDRREVALFFDTTLIESGWYGRDVQAELIPLLNLDSAHSVLLGDLLGDLLGANENQLWIRSQMESRLTGGAAPMNFCHSTQFYCVYVNNCSDEMVRTIERGLASYHAYVGCADVTYASPFKTYLSGCLTNGYLKWRRTIVQAHEDDLSDDVNQNTLGYPFEEFSYTCRSIGGMYFGLLLSYKIERPVLAGFERDQLHSLSAVSSRPSDISNCVLELDERKYEYLSKEKTGTLQRLGLLGQPKGTLEAMMKAKLRSNYLYSMRFRENYSVSTFNILLELEAIDTGQPVRALASFAYEPDRNVMRLVTFY